MRALALRPADKEVQRWAFRALANALDSGGEAARIQLCGTGTSAPAFEAVRALRQHQGTRAIELQVLYWWTTVVVLTSAREGWPLRLNTSVYPQALRLLGSLSGGADTDKQLVLHAQARGCSLRIRL